MKTCKHDFPLPVRNSRGKLVGDDCPKCVFEVQKRLARITGETK